MRKMLFSLLMLICVVLSACQSNPVSSLGKTDGLSSPAASSNADSIESVAQSWSVQTYSLPLRVEIEKNDAYYESLLRQVDSDSLWTGSSLEENLSTFAKNLLDFYGEKNITSTRELSLDGMYFFTLFHSSPADYDAYLFYDSYKDDFLVPEAIVEKNIYYYFNVKADCSVLENYDKEHGGLKETVGGYENSYDSEVISCTDKGEGRYEVSLKYRGWDTDTEDYIGGQTYIFQTEGKRIYLVSIKSFKP